MRLFRPLLPTLLLLLALALTGCQSQRARRLIADGHVAATGYLRTIPVQRYGKWLIVEVTLEGGSRPYRLLFDTGAVTVLKPSIAQELGLTTVARRPIGSATGQKRTLPFAVLPRCTVGGITFEDIGAVLLELDSSPELACLNAEIDGILGANMMRLAAWQIDFQASTIAFSDRLEALPEARTGHAIPFTTSSQGSPRIRVEAWGATTDVTLDTGKSGGIGLSAKAWSAPHYRQDTVAHAQGYGRLAVGAFGARTDTMWVAQARPLRLGDWALDTALVAISERRSHLLGNAFLSRFRVTLDWRGGMVYLLPREEVPTTLNATGLGYTWQDSTLRVSFLYEGSVAERSGLSIGSRLLRVGEQEVRRLSPNAFCRIREVGLLPAGQDSVEVQYLDSEGVPRETVLYRAPLW